MFKFKRRKEEEVKNLFKEHLEKAEETVKSMCKTVKEYLEGKIESAKELAYRTHLLESEADKKRHQIIESLYQGAFLPTIREELVQLVGIEDKIADRAESCCDFFLSQRPEVKDEFKEDFLKMTEGTLDCLPPLREALNNLFENFSLVREKIVEVNKKESEMDALEWDLTRKIFLSKISLAEKIHLRECVWHIVTISDVAQDVADALEAVIIKRQV